MQTPPLPSIRAFNAAAHHLSFTKAAEELFVTQSAISQHVRRLEDLLGLRLFVREARGLKLTPEGQRYKEDLADVFTRLQWSTERLKRSARGEEVLHIHTHTTFALHWLIPRMGQFQKKHPHVELHLTASTKPMDGLTDVHGIIRVGTKDVLGATSLFRVNLVPVCSPEYQKRHLPTGQLEELRNVTLLHSITASPNWSAWLHGVSRSDIDASSGLRFESSAMAYVAAENDVGVAMAQKEFVQKKLDAGILVKPFPEIVTTDRSYCFVPFAPRLENSALTRFRDWLSDQANSS